MANNWTNCKLGTLVSHKKGFAFKSSWFETKGVPIVRISDTTDSSININSCYRINHERAKGLKDYSLYHNDVIIATVGSWPPNYSSVVGKVIRVPVEANDALLNQNAVKLIANENIDNGFLYYLLKTNFFLKYIVNTAQGSANQASIKLTDIFDFPLNLPPLPEQRAIAEILSSLDDKIELNLQTNKTLEEMANALYKHWFVDFGPFKDGKFVESELGLIPEGWEVISLEEVTSKITDGAHLSPKSQESGYPMASVKDMFDWGINTETCRLISEEDYLILAQQGCKPLENDLLIAKDGSFLKHTFVVEKDLELVLLSSIAILRPNGKINSHLLNLYLKLDSTKERLKSIVSGAVIQRIVLKDFRKFKIVLPPLNVQSKIEDEIITLIKQCWLNIEENSALKQTRDYLLPKLISGEVLVKDAEKTVKEVV